MPTVPRVTQQRVSTQALPGVRQQGVERPPPLDLGQPGKLLGAIYEQERERADQSVYRDAEAKAARLQVDLQVELQQVGGRDAAAIPERLKESWQKGTDEIRKGLSNSRQKAAVEHQLSQRYSQLYGVAQQHMARETEKYDAATLEEHVVRSTDLAVFNAGNHEIVGTEMAKVENAIRAYADTNRSKLPDGWADRKVAESFSKIHTGVIARMLDSGEDRSAKSYFELVKGEIGGADIGRVEKALEVGSTLGESTRQLDRIIAMNLTEAESYEEAKKIEDPEIRKATGQQLDVEFGRRARAQSAQRTVDLETSYAAVLEKGTLPPTSVLARLPVTDRKNVIDFFKKAQKGDPIETNWATYVELKEMAVKDPAAFKQLNPLDYRSKLGDTEFKQFVDWHTARKAGRNADDLNGYLTVTEQVNLALKATDLSNKPDDDEQVVRFKMAANQRVADWQRDHGQKSIPPEELQKITDRMVRETVMVDTRLGQRVFPTFGKGAPDKDQRQRTTVPYKEIPVDEIDALKELFRARGKRSNTALIERAYAADRLGDYALMQSIIQGAP